MKHPLSRRTFLGAAGVAVAASVSPRFLALSTAPQARSDSGAPSTKAAADRIVDMHVHFDEKNPHFLPDLLKLSGRLNLTACVLTPFANRKIVADAARRYPAQIVPVGAVDLDARDVVDQVQELHALGYRGLGELEFVRRPFNDATYFPVYELANRYRWILLFHTGIVLRRAFDESEDVASGRMRPIYLEEIARRFPKLVVLGGHCGNPEYEWAAEIARWNPNVFFDLSGTTLTKMRSRLSDFQKIFWWSGLRRDSKTPNDDPSAYSKIVFGSDTPLDQVESVLSQYRALFDACEVPASTRQLILGGTMATLLELPI